MLLVEKNKNNIGIYCWDHFKRSNPKYGLLFFVSDFLIKQNQTVVVYCANCFDMLHPPCLNVFKKVTQNMVWLSCIGFGLQCSNPKPNNPTPNEYTYIYIYPQ